MSGFMHWLSMGGYATYVWTAYGIAGFLLTIQVVINRFQRKKMHNQLRLWYIRQSK